MEDTYMVVDSKRGDIEDQLSYEDAVRVLNEECERYADDGWTVEVGWASAGNLAACRLTTREAGIDYERFISVEREES